MVGYPATMSTSLPASGSARLIPSGNVKDVSIARKLSIYIGEHGQHPLPSGFTYPPSVPS